MEIRWCELYIIPNKDMANIYNYNNKYDIFLPLVREDICKL